MSDDASPQFLASNSQLPRTSALDEMLGRVEKNGPPEGTGVPSGAAVNPQPGTSQHSLLGRVAKDIGLGAVEAVPAAIGGVRNAYQNTINMGKELGGWLEDKANLPVIGVGKPYGVKVYSHDEAEAARQSGELHDLSDYARLPDAQLLHPQSVTGGLIQGVAQFLTGFKGFGKVMEAAGVTGAAGATAAGAASNFAVFDPHQQRLSDLIERFPQLSNPVTRFLSSKPDDSAAMSRLKNSLEGLGLGALTDGLGKAVSFVRDSIRLPQRAPQLAAEGPKDIPADAFRQLGDEHAPSEAPLVTKTEPVPPASPPPARFAFPEHPLEGQGPELTPEQVAEAARAQSGKALAPDIEPTKYTPAGGAAGDVQINFARMNTTDDVQRAIQELADHNKDEIRAATRGGQTWEATRLKAGQMEAWKLLEKRIPGDAFNAEQTVAARQLWASAADKLVTMAQQASASPSEANLFGFRKMLGSYYAIQQHVMGARAEAGRALNAWAIPTDSMANRLDEINWRMFEMGGGPSVIKDMAERVSSLATSADGEAWSQISKFAEKSAYAKGRDAVLQAWSDALLTHPLTQVKILASNATTALWRMGERGIASKISSALGTEGGVQPGEVAAQWAGLAGGWRDALAYAAKAARTGQTGGGIGELHDAYTSNLSSTALGFSKDGWIGRGIDLASTVVGLGRRGVAAQHDAALTLAYRMELHAQAQRMASLEANNGQIPRDAVPQRVAQILDNPPPNVTMEAVKGGKYQAFLDEPGKIAQLLLDARNTVPELRLILPFIKIPSRIFSYAMERTPLAPLMSEWRANFTAGGARRDLAMAQTGLGTAIMLTAADLTMTGRMKAQGPPETGLKQAQEREGERDWSAKVGNRWFDINGIHPFGKMLTLAGAATEAITGGQHELKDDSDLLNLATGTALAIAANVSNTSFTQGAANFFAVMHDSTVRGEEKQGQQALLSLAGSAIPAGVGGAARAMDPYQRAVYSMIDEFKSRIPGLSKTLPPRRNLWGEPVKNAGEGPIESLLSPARSLQATHSPIDDEILRQGFNITLPPSKVDFGHGATVDLKKYPEAYSRYLELAGHEWKAPGFGMGAKEFLNSVVSGNSPLSQVYNMRSDGPEGGKEVFIRHTLSSYREGAKQQLLKEFPALKAEADEKRANAQSLRMPVMQ